MARTKITVIPQPDPDSFAELLSRDLHLPIAAPPSTLRRWLPALLWRMGHDWITDMERQKGVEPTAVPSEPEDYEAGRETTRDTASSKTTPQTDTNGGAPANPSAPPLGATPVSSPTLDSSNSPLISHRIAPARPWMKVPTARKELGSVVPVLSRSERAKRREERVLEQREKRLAPVEVGEAAEKATGGDVESEVETPVEAERKGRLSLARSACSVKLPRNEDLLPSPAASVAPGSPLLPLQRDEPAETSQDDYILPFQLPLPSCAHKPSARRTVGGPPPPKRSPLVNRNILTIRPQPPSDKTVQPSSRTRLDQNSPRPQPRRASTCPLPIIHVQPATSPQHIGGGGKAPSPRNSQTRQASFPSPPTRASPPAAALSSSDLSDLLSSDEENGVSMRPRVASKIASPYQSSPTSGDEVDVVSSSRPTTKKRRSLSISEGLEKKKRARRSEPGRENEAGGKGELRRTKPLSVSSRRKAGRTIPQSSSGPLLDTAGSSSTSLAASFDYPFFGP